VCVLTRRYEGEEKDLWPDVIDNSSLEFLPRERALEKGILDHHGARTRRLEGLGRGDGKGEACAGTGRAASFYASSDSHHTSLSPPCLREAGLALGGGHTVLVVAPLPSSKVIHVEGGVSTRSEETFRFPVMKWTIPFPTLQGKTEPCIRTLRGVLMLSVHAVSMRRGR